MEGLLSLQVGIQHGHEIARCVLHARKHRGFLAEVAGERDKPDAVVLLPKPLDELKRFVGRTVVHKQVFKIHVQRCKQLAPDAFRLTEEGENGRFLIVAWHDDRYSFHSFPPYDSCPGAFPGYVPAAWFTAPGGLVTVSTLL